MLNTLKNAAMAVTFCALAQELARDHMTYGGGNMFIIVGAFLVALFSTVSALDHFGRWRDNRRGYRRYRR
tara:strand:- start:16 stop:225 length:210 start_codon:yes stop_codon:yes gene_type:complete